MVSYYKHIILLLIVFLSFNHLSINGQERIWDEFIDKDIENINPVYKPVMGFGVGYLNFYGDAKNNLNNPLMGSMAGRLNMHMFVDKFNHYKLNLFVMSTFFGQTPLWVRQRDYFDPSKNYNFQTDFLIFGANIHYDFDHFIKKSSFMRPFFSIGFENITFDSKADLVGKYFDTRTGSWQSSIYNYWTDGTIRNHPQSPERQSAFVINRDDIYETDIKSDTLFINTASSGNYSNNTFGLPIDAGLDFSISNRTSLRLGYSYNLTFSDNIDGINTETKIMKGNSAKDNFGFAYFSLHFDLFSDPKMIRVHNLFVELDDADFDIILKDEDLDMIPDIMDKCLRTPKNVLVDTVGCPFDEDGDGVGDFMDKQPGTPAGAIIDNDGVEISDDAVWANLNSEALSRPEVEMYLSIMNNLAGSSRRSGSVEIPEKFKKLDADGDSYISFDEVLKAIDTFFDFDSELSTQDIYELNDFFFEQ